MLKFSKEAMGEEEEKETKLYNPSHFTKTKRGKLISSYVHPIKYIMMAGPYLMHSALNWPERARTLKGEKIINEYQP